MITENRKLALYSQIITFLCGIISILEKRYLSNTKMTANQISDEINIRK